MSIISNTFIGFKDADLLRYSLMGDKTIRVRSLKDKINKTKTEKEGNTKMKENNICELVFILDRSGSMAGLENDTIGGFNSLIEKQKAEEGKCYVTTVLFDNISETVHDRTELSEISPMTADQYYVRGATALLDAVGETIEHIETIHKYIRPEDVPSKVLFVITTDGLENSSTKFDAKKVKKLVNDKKDKGWEFLFLGANIDAISAAGNIGINADRAVRYHSDSVGTAKNYDAVSNFARMIRRSAPCCSARPDASWKADIEKDFKTRNKK